MSARAYWIGIGANLGDRWGALASAVRAVAATGATIDAVSSAYETAPRELDDQPTFLNAALRAHRPHPP
ncbi:MAG TPA: 2-amino-4-hydroxy-6-hydroxymethyldihydropteridine diphosphokinase, partial [Miltoncostaeaceae bacterium]|nr:2-amino-4-hydroxy-6-hydroxymethyldihydropteridine diphosphokinase [Miltoncostaeaceae bacterium]